MNKIDELIDSIYNPKEKFDWIDIERIMKEYAEYYSKRVLEIAAKNAKWSCFPTKDDPTAFEEIVDKDSILNIQLPEHE